MDETRWLATRDVWALLGAARPRVTPRKRRLFACAAVRLGLDLVRDDSARRAVEAAEAYSDGALSKAGLRRARLLVAEYRLELLAQATERDDDPGIAREAELCRAAELAASERNLRSAAARARGLFAADIGLRHRRAAVADAVRDIFGSPFRVVPALRPEWLTADAVGLARAAHELGEFNRLPILADALEEAGCDSADLLEHLRGGGLHARGCWALDLVLGFGRDGKAPKPATPPGRMGLLRFRARRVVVTTAGVTFEGAGGESFALLREAGRAGAVRRGRPAGAVASCVLRRDRLTVGLTLGALRRMLAWDYEIHFKAGPRKFEQVRRALAAVFEGGAGYREEAG